VRPSSGGFDRDFKERRKGEREKGRKGGREEGRKGRQLWLRDLRSYSGSWFRRRSALVRVLILSVQFVIQEMKVGE